MGTFARGVVVLVRFPFSDLSHSKLRPALVLADGGRDDYILCQITSQPYNAPQAIQLDTANFAVGSLQRTSFIRGEKLFTAHASLISKEVGQLQHEVLTYIVRLFMETS